MMMPVQQQHTVTKNLVYPNIQGAESLYTQLPLDSHQKQFNYYASSGSKVPQQIPQRV